MKTLGTIATVLSIAALAIGCGSASQAAEEDAGDTDCPDDCPDAGGDTDTDGEWECPDPIAGTCPDAIDPIPLLFEASEFGEGTKFVDVAPWSVLAERDEGATRTISVVACAHWGDWSEGPCDTTNARVAELEVAIDSGLHAVALSASEYGGGPDMVPYLAAVCDDLGCALYGANLGADPPETVLAAVPGGEVPDATIIHGLWRDREDILVCAYGDGIHCFDGTAWTSPQPSNAEYPLFNDMGTAYFDDASGVIAVGDLGRIAVSGFPYWDGYWGTAYPDWYTVLGDSSFSGGHAIAGEGGVLALRNGDSWISDCAFADEDVVALFDLGESGMEWSTESTGGLTASGRVFKIEGPVTAMEGACYTGQDVGEDPRAVSFRCGIEANVFLMNEAELFGTTDCAVD